MLGNRSSDLENAPQTKVRISGLEVKYTCSGQVGPLVNHVQPQSPQLAIPPLIIILDRVDSILSLQIWRSHRFNSLSDPTVHTYAKQLGP